MGMAKASNRQTKGAINEIRSLLVWKDYLPNGKSLLYTNYERVGSCKSRENNTIHNALETGLSVLGQQLIYLIFYWKQFNSLQVTWFNFTNSVTVCDVEYGSSGQLTPYCNEYSHFLLMFSSFQ